MLYNIFPIPLHQVFMVFRFLGIISREAKVILRKKRFSFKVYVINRLTVRKKIFCVVQGMFFLYTYRSDNSYRAHDSNEKRKPPSTLTARMVIAIFIVYY